MSLAVAALLKAGVSDPSRHIAMVTAPQVATLIIGRKPLGEDDLSRLRRVVDELQFGLPIVPGTPPRNAVLRDIVGARSRAELSERIRHKPLNYEPPTDENPYFFNMLRLRYLGDTFAPGSGILLGNRLATGTLAVLIASLLALTAVTILVPLLVRERSRGAGRDGARILWSGATYFSLIGAGFMLVEIGLIQRLSTFLGHPVYALGILLFTIIASAGVASYLSERLPLLRRPWIYAFPAATVLVIAGLRFALPALVTALITEPRSVKIAVSIASIAPLGLLLGLFFPTGMRLAREVRRSETPWYWALNGIFGVLCSALAVFVSIYSGIGTNFYLAAACYAAAAPCLVRMQRAA